MVPSRCTEGKRIHYTEGVPEGFTFTLVGKGRRETDWLSHSIIHQKTLFQTTVSSHPIKSSSHSFSHTWAPFRICWVSRHGSWGRLLLFSSSSSPELSSLLFLLVLHTWSLLCAHRNLFLPLPRHTARLPFPASFAVRYDWILVVGL